MSERLIMKAEAQDHVQAYLEYRMITGRKEGDPLMPEDEYQKLREEWHKNKRAKFIRYEEPKREKAVKEFQRLGKGTKTSRKKFVVKSNYPKPIELLNQPQTLKIPITTKTKSISNKQTSFISTNKEMPKKKKEMKMRDILDNSFMTDGEKVEELENLLASGKVSQVQAFGINKQIKSMRAKIKREERKRKKDIEQMNNDLSY